MAPPRRRPSAPGTRNALFTIYAPSGLPAGRLEAQMQDPWRDYLERFAPRSPNRVSKSSRSEDRKWTQVKALELDFLEIPSPDRSLMAYWQSADRVLDVFQLVP